MANEIVQVLTNNLDASLNAVAEALPGDFNKARFLQNTISLVREKPELQKYSQKELLTGVMKAAYLGLDFMNHEAWLVPYSGHVQFQMGYKGACKFVKKYSIRPLKDIYAKAVRKGDTITYGVENGKPYLNWEPVPFNAGEIIGVFAVAYFEDAGVLYEVMTKEEVEKIRRVSKCGGSGPWKDYWEEMAKKTVLKKLSKNIETDFDNAEQRDAWESDNDTVFDRDNTPGEVIDPFATEESEDIIDVEAVEVVKDVPEVEAFK